MEYEKYKKKIDELFRKHDLVFVKNTTDQLIFEKCPFCGKEKKFYFSMKFGTWLCFSGSCGEKGNIVTLVSKLENISIRAAIEYLKYDVERIPSGLLNSLEYRDLLKHVEEEKKLYQVQEVELPSNIRKFKNFSLDFLQKYRRFFNYAYKRGLTKEILDHFDIGFSTSQERIIFPVKYRGKVVGWQGRLIDDNKITKTNPKALTEPFGVFKKSEYLFNYDSVYDKEYITIVEGPIDCCKTFKHNSVALLGKTVSQRQFELIREMKNLKKIYIGLDPEATKDIENTYRLFSPYYECYLIKIEEGSDCGDKTVEEIEKYVKNAVTYSYLELQPSEKIR